MREGEKAPLPAGYFGFRLKQNVINWSPCEIEAYTHAKGLDENGIYFRESENEGIILSDSQNCVDCSKMLRKGVYSTSARLQTFIISTQKYNVDWKHISGKLPTPLIEAADFSSRNPVECNNPDCKVCELSKLADTSFSTIGAMQHQDVSNIPMAKSKRAWKEIQSSCKVLRRVATQLKGGTAPRKKERNINDVRLLLRKATLNKDGVLVVKSTLPFDSKPTELIVIPRDFSESILTLLHYKEYDHPSTTQMVEMAKRKYFILDVAKVAKSVRDDCKLCVSRDKLPKEETSYETETKATVPGTFYNADVLNQHKKKVLLVRENLTSFTQTKFIKDEKKETLREGLVEIIYRFKPNMKTIVRVDCHSSFKALKDDKLLQNLGIVIQLGDEKNVNKNGVAEKAIQELENEILKVNPKNMLLDEILLSKATFNLNSKIRFTKRSSKELLFKRDQTTGDALEIKDIEISDTQYKRRKRDNDYKKKVKKTGDKVSAYKPGDVVIIRGEKDKSRNRDTYLITEIQDNQAICIKTNPRSRGIPYKVKLQDIYKIVGSRTVKPSKESDESSSDEVLNLDSGEIAQSEVDVGSRTSKHSKESDVSSSDEEQNSDLEALAQTDVAQTDVAPADVMQEPDTIEASDRSDPGEDESEEERLPAATPRRSKRSQPKIDYNLFNETGEKAAINQSCAQPKYIPRFKCSFCEKSRYKYFSHDPDKCERMLDARSITHKIIPLLGDDSEDSTDDEENLDEQDINETILKIRKLNTAAAQIITIVRNILREGVDLDEYNKNDRHDLEEEGLEICSLDWVDFDNTLQEIADEDLIDRQHLLTFAKSYDGDASDSASSVFTKSSDEDINWQLHIRSDDERHSSDSESSSVSTMVKFAQLAKSRNRSVSVSENILELTVEPRRRSVSVTVNMLNLTEQPHSILEEELAMIDIDSGTPEDAIDAANEDDDPLDD